MTGKTLLGVVVTGIALFMFGFVYWAVNPLPYSAWNDVDDAAAMQTAAAKLFPESGVYFLPGAGNDPEALKLLETGPSVYVSIDHTPTPGSDPVALGIGLLHNIASALLLVFLLKGAASLGAMVQRSLGIAVVAVFIINGSEIIWWQQPFNWLVHQMIYYLIYFALGAAILSFFLPKPGEGEPHTA